MAAITVPTTAGSTATADDKRSLLMRKGGFLGEPPPFFALSPETGDYPKNQG